MWPASSGGPVGPLSLLARVSSFYRWSFVSAGSVSLCPFLFSAGPYWALSTRSCLLYSFRWPFSPSGLAGLGGWSLWSCEADGRRPSGWGRHSSWPFVYLLFSSRIPALVSLLLLVGKGCSTDIIFSKAEVVFYFYVHDIFRMLPSASCCLFGNQ